MISVRLFLALAAAPLLVTQFLSPVAWADCTYGTPGCPYPPFGSSGADTQSSLVGTLAATRCHHREQQAEGRAGPTTKHGA